MEIVSFLCLKTLWLESTRRYPRLEDSQEYPTGSDFAVVSIPFFCSQTFEILDESVLRQVANHFRIPRYCCVVSTFAILELSVR